MDGKFLQGKILFYKMGISKSLSIINGLNTNIKKINSALCDCLL